MTPAIALARAELIMLARNRVAAVTGVLIPVAAGIWLITNPPPADVPGGIVGGVTALMLVTLTGMTVAATATTTLVARRQQHLLERWRISGTAAPLVLVGTLTPACLLFLAGSAILFAASGYSFDAVPAQPALLVIAVVLAAALGCAVAFVTAAFTRTPETAQITLFPALAALIGGGLWALSAPAGEITWRMRVTGGGALTELVRVGWEGPAGGGGVGAALAASGPSALVLLGLAVAASLVAARAFRWQARG